MADSFYPYPIVKTVGYLGLAVFLSAFSFQLQNLLGDFFLYALGAIWLLSLLMIALLFILARFHFVELEEKSISYTSGILSTRKVVLSYSKITESTYSQSLLQRIFNVGTLHVDSAGGSAVAIHVEDVKKADLDKILSVINENAGSDSGD